MNTKNEAWMRREYDDGVTHMWKLEPGDDFVKLDENESNDDGDDVS